LDDRRRFGAFVVVVAFFGVSNNPTTTTTDDDSNTGTSVSWASQQSQSHTTSPTIQPLLWLRENDAAEKVDVLLLGGR